MSTSNPIKKVVTGQTKEGTNEPERVVADERVETETNSPEHSYTHHADDFYETLGERSVIKEELGQVFQQFVPYFLL